MKSKFKRLQWLALAFAAACSGSCTDNDVADPTAVPFDPGKPVVISDFTPKEGGAYQKLLIYGENFGTDKSQVKVTIGGKEAVVINVKSTYVYCFVPSGAFGGDIQVTVGQGEQASTATASTCFAYEKKMVVSTLCGFRNNRDDQGWNSGPFDGADNERARGFAKPGFMAIDPRNRNHIYICYDEHKQIELIDLEKRRVDAQMDINTIPNDRIRGLCFNKAIPGYAEEGDYLLIAIDYNGRGDESPVLYIAKRNEETGMFDNGSDVQLLASYRQCNGVTVHPFNGEVYFNSFEKGQVYRLDLRKYFDTINAGLAWDPLVKNNPDVFEFLFTIANPQWNFQLFFHPTGKYAYINIINKNYIMRSTYDDTTQRLITPYNFAGGFNTSGYVDDVGTSARFNNPRQGAFVYNPEYEGNEDEYDFYIADRANYCIRKMTPEGIVTTYAGRGTSTSLADGHQWGSDDGELREVARFREVCGMVYDDQNDVFYIQDEGGRTIRTISMEKEPGEESPSSSGEETGTGSESSATGNETETSNP